MSDLAGVLPRITIITPSFQQEPYLEECLRSVNGHDYPALEHIVVDGGSTDGSKAIIEQYADKLAWWCSEKDNGQSDAINKGLAHATGEVFGWLNSDDALLPGALQRVGEAFAADPQLQVFGGRIVHRDPNGDRVFEKLNDAADVDRLHADPVINQPATFYRMSAVRDIGGVDPALRYVMDMELWWQLLFRRGTDHLRFEPVQLAMFRLHDQSKTVSAHAGFLDEIASLLHGMCRATGQDDLARVIANGHQILSNLRGIPVRPDHRAVVRMMAVHFLLKWQGLVHREHQFRMMKRLRTTDISGVRFLDEEMEKRWHALADLDGAANWIAFRARRKWRSLVR